jgi:hypothetical protein
MACCCRFLCSKTFEKGDNSCCHLLCSNTNRKKKVIIVSLLSSPFLFQLEKNGDDSKFDAMVFFVATIIEEKKSDNSKLAVVAHFRFKQT